MLAQQRDAEAENRLARLAADLGTVHIECYFLPVGIDLDLGLLLTAVDITLSAEVDESFRLVPGGLVEIEGVLAQTSVKGDKSLLVLAVLAALVTPVRGKVEEVPDVRRPKVGALLDHFEHMLMVERLILLGVVPLLGMAAVEGGVCVRAVLRKADDALRVLRVILVKKLVRLLQLPEVPAEVEIIAVDVGDLENRAFDLQHEHVGHGGESGLVHTVAQLVERPVVFQQLLIHSARGGDLVTEPPHRDAGVVIALGNEFAHLVERVLPGVCHMHGDIGDLRPDHDAVFIAEIVEFLRVLIVGKAQGVRAKLADDGHVRRVIFIAEGVALALEILVAAYAAKRVASAVEKEALLGIAGKDTAAEPGRNLVSGGKLRRGGIEIRIVHAVPEMDILDHELCAALDSLCLAVNSYVNRFGVVPGLHRDGGGLFLQIDHRRDLDAGCSVLEKLKMLRRDSDQLHIPVQSAVEGEVRLLRVDRGVVLVIDGDRKDVLLLKLLRQLDAEGGVAALVADELFAVEPHLRRHGGAVYFEKQALPRGFFRRKLPHIPACSAVIIVAAVLPVDGVPGVRQRDRLAPGGKFHGLRRGDGGF